MQKEAEQTGQKTDLKKKSKKKIIIIVSIIVICLILIYVISRITFMNYSIKKSNEMLREVLVENLNSINTRFAYLNYTPTDNVKELKKRNLAYKESIENQLNDLKTKGETEIYDFGEYNLVNGSVATNKIMIDSILVSINEYFIDILEENNDLQAKKIREKFNALPAQFLDTIRYLVESVRIISVLKESFSSLEKNSEDWNDNIREKIEAVETFSVELETLTEEEISKLNLKEKCSKMFFKEIENTIYAEGVKSSTIETILLIKKRASVVCEKLEGYQKQNAIKMLQRTKTEKNPFIVIGNKIYLNLFVKCNDEWFSSEKQKTCTESYIEQFKAELSSPTQKRKL